MADKDQKDLHKVTTPKAKTEYHLPNDMKESLKDLDAFETVTKNQLLFNDPTGDRMKKEKHKPAAELPAVLKNTTDDKKLPLYNIRENEGHKLDKEVRKEIERAHEVAPAAAVTNIVEASNRSMDLERKIKDSNKTKDKVKYHGDKFTRQPKTDKYKNINRETIRTKDVIAALDDLYAFQVLADLPRGPFTDDDFKKMPQPIPVPAKRKQPEPLKAKPFPPTKDDR